MSHGQSYRLPLQGALIALVLLPLACTSGGPAHQDQVPAGWPVARTLATVSSSFGQRQGRWHEGIDLAAPARTVVRVTAAGRITFAGRSRGRYGKLVIVDHGNGFETRYAHLADVAVRRGAKVHRGEKIGRVGRTGNATGYHLHYEVRIGGRPVDPSPYL